jgi:hypothetical protein
MNAARYEFRVWGRDLDEPRQRLAREGRAAGRDRGREIYILCQPDPDLNVKLREGALEVKVLLQRQHGLEQWQPRLKAPLPVSRRTLQAELFPLLGVEPPLSPERALDEHHLLAALSACEGLRILPLLKHRERFAYDGCSAERAEVSFAGRILENLALEAEDPEALLAAARSLGIAGRPNRAYPRALLAALETSAIEGKVDWYGPRDRA